MSNYFRKYKSLHSTTLSSSISTGTSETITLANVTNVPTTTEITITIDRVDSAGTATPTKMERITGTLSGSNLTSYTRGADSSTEQAHSAGAVVEMVWNAADWNTAIDGFDVEHSLDGTHDNTKVVMMTGNQTVAGVKTFTSPVINTGISGTAFLDEDDMASNSATKACSQQSIKAYVDGKVGLSSQCEFTTYDLTTASGDQAITGVGFKPTSVECLAFINGAQYPYSHGFADSDRNCKSAEIIQDGKIYVDNSNLINIQTAGGATQTCNIKSYDNDGMTLTWTKTGTPSGTLQMMIRYFK